jgi:hypothetical protein
MSPRRSSCRAAEDWGRYTKRIIDGCPYTAKNQLTMRGIIPQAAYDKIKDQIIVHRPKP